MRDKVYWDGIYVYHSPMSYYTTAQWRDHVISVTGQTGDKVTMVTMIPTYTALVNNSG